MLKGIRVTLTGAENGRSVTYIEKGFDVIPLRSGGGVEIVGSLGRVQHLTDEASIGSVGRDGTHIRPATGLPPDLTKSRRIPLLYTWLETHILQPQEPITVWPAEVGDVFKRGKRSTFTSVRFEAVPFTRKR